MCRKARTEGIMKYVRRYVGREGRGVYVQEVCVVWMLQIQQRREGTRNCIYD